jgi:chromosomal replication initiator protein
LVRFVSRNEFVPGRECVTTCSPEVVAALGKALARRIGEPRYNLWFGANTKFFRQEDVLLVGVPNHFFQEWLQNTFADAVRTAAAEVIGRPLAVRFVIDPELFRAARKAQEEHGTEGREGAGASERRPQRNGGVCGGRPEDADPAAAHAPQKPREPPDGPAGPTPRAAKRPRRWRRLADFLVGPCNRVAHASALSVVETPGQGGNPLVLYGPTGTGKTHLLEGVYVGLRKGQVSWRVLFVTAEEFTNRFVQAMRLNKLAAFRHYFRTCDALLVDDLHFLAGKRATLEEFQHTFDALQAGDRPLVITADCHPRLADELPAELTDRLLGGAVWGLSPPEPDTRLAILRAKAARGEPAVPDDVLRLLSEHLRGNVRELEGALHGVRHYSRVTGRPADLSLAREALGDLLRHAVRVVRLADVDRAVCKALRLEGGALQSRQRAWAVSHPRMLAMYLARKHTAAAYSEIGRHFGGRNHSTAVAAEKKVRRWLETDAELALGDRRLRVRDVVGLAERELFR